MGLIDKLRNLRGNIAATVKTDEERRQEELNQLAGMIAKLKPCLNELRANNVQFPKQRWGELKDFIDVPKGGKFTVRIEFLPGVDLQIDTLNNRDHPEKLHSCESWFSDSTGDRSSDHMWLTPEQTIERILSYVAVYAVTDEERQNCYRDKDATNKRIKAMKAQSVIFK